MQLNHVKASPSMQILDLLLADHSPGLFSFDSAHIGARMSLHFVQDKGSALSASTSFSSFHVLSLLRARVLTYSTAKIQIVYLADMTLWTAINENHVRPSILRV